MLHLYYRILFVLRLQICLFLFKFSIILYSYILSITLRTTFAKCYTQYAIHRVPRSLLYRSYFKSRPDARARILIPLQDLVPDHFGPGLIAIAHAQIIAEVLIIVEPNHATVIIAAPALRVDTDQHQIDSQNRSRCSFVRPIRLSCPNICWQITVLRSDSLIDRVTSSQHC